MRHGFSMIELIFVIVILGILASVALPKLAATRDDAMISALLEDVSNIQKSVPAYVMAQNKVSIKDAVQLSGWSNGCSNFTLDTASSNAVSKSLLAGDLQICVDTNGTTIADDPILRVKFLVTNRSDIVARLQTAFNISTSNSLNTKTVNTPDINATLKGMSISW